jgi:hypothetical protein
MSLPLEICLREAGRWELYCPEIKNLLNMAKYHFLGIKLPQAHFYFRYIDVNSSPDVTPHTKECEDNHGRDGNMAS